MSKNAFEQMMLKQMKLYTRRRMLGALRLRSNDPGTYDIIFGMKTILMNVDALAESIQQTPPPQQMHQHRTAAAAGKHVSTPTSLLADSSADPDPALEDARRCIADCDRLADQEPCAHPQTPTKCPTGSPPTDR